MRITNYYIYDGSGKDGCGSHAHGFTSGKIKGKVWGGADITPGGRDVITFGRARRSHGNSPSHVYHTTLFGTYRDNQ